MAVKKMHYFVMSAMGQSAARRGPFISADAAREWAQKNCGFPTWIVPAEPVSDVHRPLDKDGNTSEE